MARALTPERRLVRWWEARPDVVRRLEGDCWHLDSTIRRLKPLEIATSRDLREPVKNSKVEPEDVLAYEALAEGRFGLYRLVAVFPIEPHADDPRTNPKVFCLDGPRGPDASEHRNSDIELCLWFRDDPRERRWTVDHGLHRLFALARQHLICEHYVRTTGRPWPIDEAPHGETQPAEPAPEFIIPPPRRPGRNDQCPCGSGRKAKKCCFK